MGTLVAVLGSAVGAPTAETSRMLATQLARRAARGAVLLTAARDIDSLAAARTRHGFVVADFGATAAESATVLASACRVVVAPGSLCRCSHRITNDVNG